MIDINDAIKTVWLALEGHREHVIPGDDTAWDDICTAMAVIEEEITA
tara:strand:- start:229 stop:369 length:141 start_codon:yes stop_codon:yes gene_type:complete